VQAAAAAGDAGASAIDGFVRRRRRFEALGAVDGSVRRRRRLRPSPSTVLGDADAGARVVDGFVRRRRGHHPQAAGGRRNSVTSGLADDRRRHAVHLGSERADPVSRTPVGPMKQWVGMPSAR
jgi:hypothetical protein